MIWKNESLDKEAAFAFCSDYMDFLSGCKTEREVVSWMIKELKAAGAHDLDELKEAPKAGELVYSHKMNKALIIFRMGEKPLECGLRILGAHIDSPRLDLKQHPVYEDTELALLETHYYGGIKKYQWTALPLALHGVVAKTDGSVISINIGEKPEDPVFCVSDLLPHLGHAQMEKKLGDAIEGEKLNILCGSIPLKDEEKEAVKKNVLEIIRNEYNIEEDDFISAEIEVVPAGRARDLGFDKSCVIGYGQDDRVCAYTSFKAIMEYTAPEITSVCLLTDKEEIGSVGATGAHSRFFEDSVVFLMDACGGYSETAVRKCFKNTQVLSSDVSAAFDPNYPEVMEKNNSCYLGYGPVFNKYTGARGKSGSNDANAEYIAYLRSKIEKENIIFQTSELGKVDEGGGGTIAYILARLGMEVIDFGVAVLNMHAPFEVTSKADIYEAYRAYVAFLK